RPRHTPSTRFPSTPLFRSRGMTAEANRAMIWQIDARTGAHRPYATGLRNPTALTIHPETEQLWAVVNERDEIGPNLVPDYLTSVDRKSTRLNSSHVKISYA